MQRENQEKIINQIHRLSIKTNNSVQELKQEIILFKEANKKDHEEMRRESKKEHERLEQLIIAGDKGAVNLKKIIR